MEQVLALLDGLPGPLIYGALALGAAIENILPIVPADTFIVTGGFVAGIGTVNPWAVFLAVWGFNVLGAVAVYWAGFKYGLRFFLEGPGRYVLSSGQLDRIEAFYDRWGVAAIFTARFLPAFRALVPVFAGVSRQHWSRVVPPLLLASAIWYGALVRFGYLAGENLDAVKRGMATANRGLWIVSVAISALVLGFWWRTRRRSSRTAAGEAEDGG